MNFGSLFLGALIGGVITILPFSWLLTNIPKYLSRFYNLDPDGSKNAIISLAAASFIALLVWVALVFSFYSYTTGIVSKEASIIRKNDPEMVAKKFLTIRDYEHLIAKLIDPKVKETPEGKALLKWRVNEGKKRKVWMGGSTNKPFQVTPDKVIVTNIDVIDEIEKTETFVKYRITGTYKPFKFTSRVRSSTSYDFKDTTWNFSILLSLINRDKQWYVAEIN